jgi:hypothetical protein
MNYYEVYANRLNLFGDTNKERVTNEARINFENYLAMTPNKEKVVINDFEYQAAILSSGQDLTKTIKKMLIAYDAEVSIGNLVEWEYFIENSPQNYWVILREEQLASEGYRKFYMTRCNKLINWIDKYGVVNSSMAYQLGSADKLLREMFAKNSRNIITLDLTQYVDIIMPFNDSIMNETRIIIGSQAWEVVNYDKVTVDGLIFFTLKESLVNLDIDKLVAKGDEIDLGDTNKEHLFTIEIKNEDITIVKNEDFVIAPMLFKDNIMQPNHSFAYKINDEWVMLNIDDKLIDNEYIFNSSNIGTYEITIALDEQLSLTKKFTINVVESSQLENTYYIEGVNAIRWGRTENYILHKYIDGVETNVNCLFSINNDFATIVAEDNICAMTANNKNLSGVVTLTADADGETFTKDIKIISLWQVM